MKKLLILQGLLVQSLSLISSELESIDNILSNNIDKPLIVGISHAKFDQSLDILDYADNWISGVDIGVAKEDQKFWEIATEKLSINSSESIFFDDNISIINSALKYGIKKSVHITEPTNNNSVINKSDAKIQIKKLNDLFRADQLI